jgi:hypothetical protein
MTHNEFNHLLHSIKALTPEQMRQLREELDSELAHVVPPPEPPAAKDAASPPARKPVWERIQERTAAIPDEEWDKLPTDLAEQHDHYLYGTPKHPPA